MARIQPMMMKKHTPPLCSTMRYPGVAYVEVDDRKQKVQGIEKGLEGWLDVRLVGGSQVATIDISEEESTEEQQHDQP